MYVIFVVLRADLITRKFCSLDLDHQSQGRADLFCPQDSPRVLTQNATCLDYALDGPPVHHQLNRPR